jgi:hypothetical protein
MNEGLFVTVTGVWHYYGTKPFSVGAKVMLVKEPDNHHDGEAIRVEMPFIGKVGYVANSAHTVAKGTFSAGRAYDRMDAACFAEVAFLAGDTVIARLLPHLAAWTVTVGLVPGDPIECQESRRG